ncbi:hypothetical protein [Microbacterium sp. LWS13-1.2]|uniref:Uncharacterized protein n=1 Tax=Microbacterium sp. LWS13-1.2 TaxID=3135264 RepID=A0AAU6SCK9_9MICO
MLWWVPHKVAHGDDQGLDVLAHDLSSFEEEEMARVPLIQRVPGRGYKVVDDRRRSHAVDNPSLERVHDLTVGAGSDI